MRVRLAVMCLIAVWGCVSASGCGGGRGREPVPAKGVLTWDDGTPVAKAAVVFVPKDKGGKRASGPTKDDGSFELSTLKAGDGALPGDYIVLVTKLPASYEVPAGASKTNLAELMAKYAKQREKEAEMPNPFPEIYGREEASPLSWKLEAGKKIELKIKKQP